MQPAWPAATSTRSLDSASSGARRSSTRRAHLAATRLLGRYIDILPGYPYIAAPIAAAATQRSKPQVYKAVEQLRAAGVLEVVGRAGRAAVYEAIGLLPLLAALEREDLAEDA